MGRTLGNQLFVRVHIFLPPTRPPTDTSPRRMRNISICETLRSAVHPELVHESTARSSKAVRGSDPCLRRRAITLRRSRSFFLDRKSTRLNSSHVKISYAVFCL